MKRIIRLNIEELIKSRRTAHEFKPDPIDFDLVYKAIELMAYAPNHKHTFPWGAYRLDKFQKSNFISLVVEKKVANDKSASEEKRKAIRTKFESIPEIVCLLQKKQDDEFTEKEDYASVACGVQILSLFLCQYDIACKWSTTKIMQQEKFKSALNVDWSKWKIQGLLFIGKAARIPSRPERPKVLLNI